MNLKGTKTEQNLQTAFAGESQARNKYTFYASQAKKEGFEQIAALFTETANNEKEHAKMWFKLLNGGIGKTVDNLKDAAAGENYEWTDMYATFAKEAREEGFDHIANSPSIFGSISFILSLPIISSPLTPFFSPCSFIAINFSLSSSLNPTTSFPHLLNGTPSSLAT